ncbi:M81 family metallopeptidase [Castellaniella sp. GW247-6E4]|uniref:M81 family metallopeptidase n=1 Tax=Castellaniella sp. GW247-6E4 TaxID=3140380 RepID=UPI003314CA1D
MKIIIASISHETNSFSPVPTSLRCFGVGDGPLFGQDALSIFRNTRTPFGAFVDIAEEKGHQIVTPVVARCSPSGPVEDTAYRVISESLIQSVRDEHCDALLLDLHGAMITESLDDGEGFLLERLREIAPDLPIGVALDFHANVSERIVKNSTVLMGYKTYPHVDMYETGTRVANMLFESIAGTIRPKISWNNLPMLPHTLCMDTGQEPMAGLIRMTIDAEQEESVLAASVFGGFPLSDTYDAGFSCVVVTDADRPTADRVRDRILAEAWERRADFVYQPEPLSDAIARAQRASEGPILLIDHADNCNSGGTLDSMEVIAEVLRQGLTGVAAAPVCDPEVAEQLHRVGCGGQITVDLGEKVAAKGITGTRAPLRLSGRVTGLSNGRLVVEGPVYTGTELNMGKSAAFTTDNGITIVVTSRRIEPYDLNVFRAVGVEPTEQRFLILKSRIQYKPAYLPIAKGVIECNGRGVASSDYGIFKFQRIRRPIYPLDADAATTRSGRPE